MSEYLHAFENLLDKLRRRGFKTDSIYINYLYEELSQNNLRAQAMFAYYGVKYK